MGAERPPEQIRPTSEEDTLPTTTTTVPTIITELTAKVAAAKAESDRLEAEDRATGEHGTMDNLIKRMAARGELYELKDELKLAHQRNPYVGQPATIHLYSDSLAGVVTRVTANTITVARVKTAESRPDMASDEGAYGLRPTLAEGILDQIIEGSAARLTYRHGMWRNGSLSGGTRATLGYSRSRIDWCD